MYIRDLYNAGYVGCGAWYIYATGNNGGVVSIPGVPSVGEWHNLTFTRRGNIASFYDEGTLIGSLNVSQPTVGPCLPDKSMYLFYGTASGTSVQQFAYVKKYTANEPQHGGWVAKTSAPNLVVTYQNTVFTDYNTTINIAVVDNEYQPINASIGLTMNNNVVASASSSNSIVYNFTPGEAGDYRFRVDANNANFSTHYEGKIIAVGSISNVLQYNENNYRIASDTIDMAVTDTADAITTAAISLGTEGTQFAVKNYMTSLWPTGASCQNTLRQVYVDFYNSKTFTSKYGTVSPDVMPFPDFYADKYLLLYKADMKAAEKIGAKELIDQTSLLRNAEIEAVSAWCTNSTTWAATERNNFRGYILDNNALFVNNKSDNNEDVSRIFRLFGQDISNAPDNYVIASVDAPRAGHQQMSWSNLVYNVKYVNAWGSIMSIIVLILLAIAIIIGVLVGVGAIAPTGGLSLGWLVSMLPSYIAAMGWVSKLPTILIALGTFSHDRQRGARDKRYSGPLRNLQRQHQELSDQ